MEFLTKLIQELNFDPFTSILIIVIFYFARKSIGRLTRTVMVHTCKLQAIYEGIQKYSENGQGAYIRQRESALLKENNLIEGG